MWIIPKQLHTSVYVQDTKELGQDSEEFSQTCEKSLTWRGKDSLQRTWLQRWKREGWMQHLSSRTLKHSHIESFVDAWTSSLEGSRANLSVVLESVKELKIPGISSLTSETASENASPELFSSKTLKELSLVKRPMENQFSNMSSENWKDWVTSQRQEFSQRVKSAHLTRESVSSSLGSGMNWGTPATNDANKTPHCEVNSKQAGLTRSVGRAEANWATPNTMDVLPARSPEKLAEAKKKGGCKNLREEVMNWATPNTMDHMAQRSPEALQRQFETTRKGRTQPANLREQVHPQNWPTSRTSDAEGGRIDTIMTEDGFKSKRHKSNQYFGAKLRDAVETYEENWPTPTTAEGTKIGNQPNYGQVGLSNHPSIVGHPDRAKLNKSGKNQESWPTPNTSDQYNPNIPHDLGRGYLRTEVLMNKKQWATPRANKVHPEITDQNREQLANRGKANLEEDVAGHCGKATGKLNPDWVEQLMGLPVGWTDLGSWATESSQLPQPKPSSPSSKG